MGILRLVLGIFFLYSLSGCVKMMHAIFKETYPISNPIKFFIGNTKSDGAIENRAGKPTARIKTETVGIAKENVIKIEQDLFPEEKKTTIFRGNYFKLMNTMLMLQLMILMERHMVF